jgi:hypothetical protein
LLQALGALEQEHEATISFEVQQRLVQMRELDRELLAVRRQT